MKRSTTVNSNDRVWAIPALFIGAVAAMYLLYLHLPYIVDWLIFAQLHNHISNPYTITGFTNPPYLFLFLPHAFLPIQLSTAVNAALNITMLVIANKKFKGGLLGLVLIFSSFYMVELIANDNIDWLPLLGVMSPPWLGLIMLSVKPQALAGIGLIWLKKHGPKILIPVTIVFAASLFIWRGWPLEWLHATTTLYGLRFFPFLVPLGLFMLYRAWRTNDEVLAVMSTCCLVPYFGLYSLTGVMAIAGKKYQKWSIALWVIGWAVLLPVIIIKR